MGCGEIAGIERAVEELPRGGREKTLERERTEKRRVGDEGEMNGAVSEYWTCRVGGVNPVLLILIRRWMQQAVPTDQKKAGRYKVFTHR
jgi:hypothetical protein